MVTVIVGIGMPGSNKTEFLEVLAKKEGAVYISASVIRQRLNRPSPINPEIEKDNLWDEMYRLIYKALDADSDIVIDATNARWTDRLRLITHCRNHKKKCLIKGIWFKITIDAVLEKNAQRVRPLSEFSLGRMWGWLESHPPTESEGFDVLVEFNAHQR